jgi:predicted nucleic acid-binding protein
VSGEDKPVVLDTNILFSALLNSRSGFAQTLLTSRRRFFICETVIIELFKNKDKIVRLSALSEDEIIRLFHVLLRRLTLCKEELFSAANRATAYDLCREVDEADSPHVALALEIGGLLWTGDKKLMAGLKGKGFDHFFEPAS